jgi:hypothetical protein
MELISVLPCEALQLGPDNGVIKWEVFTLTLPDPFKLHFFHISSLM